jgi:hypothetical protein
MLWWRKVLNEIRETAWATWEQTLRLVRYVQGMWRRHSLNRASLDAQRNLGQKLYEAGVGNPRLRSQIASQDGKIRQAEAAQQSTGALKGEREQIVLQLAGSALAQVKPVAGAEADHAKAMEAEAALRNHAEVMTSAKAGLWPKDKTTWRRTLTGFVTVGSVCVLLMPLMCGRSVGALLSGGVGKTGAPSTGKPGSTSGYGWNGSGTKGTGGSSTTTNNQKADEFAERLRKVTGAGKTQLLICGGNQAASMFQRPQPLSPEWKKHGQFRLYNIAGNGTFQAEKAFLAVGKPDRVLQGPWLSSFQNPPGKDWQEWVWLQNGLAYRCWVENVSALKEGRAVLEVRGTDEVCITCPGLLVGGDPDF